MLSPINYLQDLSCKYNKTQLDAVRARNYLLSKDLGVSLTDYIRLISNNKEIMKSLS